MKPKIICEIGCNHLGDIKIAKKMIKIAKEFCNVDVVKFQKRCPKELLSKEEYNKPHPVPHNSYGSSYGEHREFLEFSLEQNAELKEFCQKNNVEYSTSVWDLTSAKEIVSLGPKMIKIPSAVNNNYELLEWICKNYKGEIHISLGMTYKEEEDKIINIAQKTKKINNVVLYHCVSGYPVLVEDLYLIEIKNLIKKYRNDVKGIGFSGHHTGIAADISALTLGATYFERHFTLDRTWKGTDHAASLEPDGLRRLVRDLKSVNKALKSKTKEVLDIEEFQRKKLKFSP
tara:strand:- start:1994 stop:2854 length:861 start_codon:yes stop_codon:yes gene_type:complete